MQLKEIQYIPLYVELQTLEKLPLEEEKLEEEEEERGYLSIDIL